MTDAFLCDFCGEYFPGDPSVELYKKVYHDGQGTDFPKAADVCVDCASEKEFLDDAEGGE